MCLKNTHPARGPCVVETWRKAFSAHAIAVFGGAPALPDDCVMNRFAGFAIPEDGRFALIGDADGGDLIGLYVGFSQDYVSGVELRRPDVFGPVFDPAGLGVKLSRIRAERLRSRDLSGRKESRASW